MRVANNEDIEKLRIEKYPRKIIRGTPVNFKCKQCGNESTLLMRTVLSNNFDFICRSCQGKNGGKIGQNAIREKYGSLNFWTEERLEHRKQECLKKYGVEHNLQRPEIIKAGQIASHSKETKEKVRKTCLKKFGGTTPFASREIRQKSRRGYFYEDTYFDSSWELAYYLWLKNQNKQFLYHPKELFFTFEDENGNERRYEPDFLIEGKIYEIKGDQFFNKKGEPFDAYKQSFWWAKYNLLKQYGVIILKESDVKPALEFVKKEFGKDFLKSCKYSPEK